MWFYMLYDGTVIACHIIRVCVSVMVRRGLFWLPVLEGRQNGLGEPSHVINIDIQDNHEEATIGAFMICDLCSMVSTCDTACISQHGWWLIDWVITEGWDIYSVFGAIFGAQLETFAF